MHDFLGLKPQALPPRVTSRLKTQPECGFTSFERVKVSAIGPGVRGRSLIRMSIPPLTTRTPILVLRFVGWLLLRLAERQWIALLFQPPPRSRRRNDRTPCLNFVPFGGTIESSGLRKRKDLYEKKDTSGRARQTPTDSSQWH